MKAIHCTAYGEPDALKLVEVEVPTPGAGEVLIEVEAVGLGYVDGLVVAGAYQVKTPPPFVPGNEAAGTVVAVGEGVPGEMVGTRVMLLAQKGALAERIVAPATQCVPLSPSLSAEAAAASLVNYSTAIYGFEECGALKPGELVLVLGASGGVGSAAMDVARGLGAEIVAAASTGEKLAHCKAEGADFTVNYADPDWRKSLEATLEGRKIDVVYDPVGGQWSETAFRCLGPGGRHLVIGFAGGEIPKLPLNLALLKRSSLVGVDWGGHVRANPLAAVGIFRRLMELAEAGKIHPKAGATYPLEEVPAVLKKLLGRESIGKPVIVL